MWLKILKVSFLNVSADTMLLPASLLIGLLCLSHAGGAQGFARLLDDVELRSAFSVARTNSMEGGPKMTVTFDTVYVNIGGDFDPKAGLLRCRIPGAYYFSFTVGKFPHKDLSVMLMKNRNEVQAIVYEENAGEERKVCFRTLNQHWPLVLSAIQSIWVLLLWESVSTLEPQPGQSEHVGGTKVVKQELVTFYIFLIYLSMRHFNPAMNACTNNIVCITV